MWSFRVLEKRPSATLSAKICLIRMQRTPAHIQNCLYGHLTASKALSPGYNIPAKMMIALWWQSIVLVCLWVPIPTARPSSIALICICTSRSLKLHHHQSAAVRYLHQCVCPANYSHPADSRWAQKNASRSAIVEPELPQWQMFCFAVDSFR